MEAPVGMAILDLDGCWTRVNKRFSDLTGYAEEELLGRSFTELTHPDDAARDHRRSREMLSGQLDSYTQEKRYVRKDGEQVTVQLAASIVRDDEGLPLHYVAHVRDITERARLDARLEDAARALDLASELICTGDMGGRLIELHGSWTEVLGWSTEELRSFNVVELVHPDDWARTLDEATVLADGGSFRFFRNRWRRKGGGWVWLSWNAVGVPEEGRIYCVARDITAYVETEQELELQAEIAANMAEGVCLVTINEDPRVVYANASLERILGYPKGQLQGTPGAVVFQPPDRSRSEEAAIDEAVEEISREGTSSTEMRLVRSDGETVWCRTSSSSFNHPEHGPVWVTAVQDISRERMAREAWSEVERSKSEFFSSVSHDLRTPLTSILGYTTLLRQSADALPPDARDNLAVIERNAMRLLRLVEDLLDVARAQAGDFELEVGRLDLAAVVRETVEGFRPTADEQGIGLAVLAKEELMIEGDEDRLGQVVENLVSNAVKYTPRGGRVQVRLRPEGRRALLEVSDTGVGIGASARTQVFERRYRGSGADESSSVVAMAEGAGLGLSIARSLVEAHAGTIAVKRTGSGGTTIEVRLPLPLAPA